MIKWINVSPTRNSETAYLRRDPIMQPRGDDPQRSYRVIGPRRQRGRLKPRPTNVSRTPEDEKTYQGLHKPILPLPLDAGDPTRSRSIGTLQYGLQKLKKNLQNVSRDDDKSIASNTHLSANGSTTRKHINISATRLTKSGNDTAVTNLRIHKTRTLEQRTTHSFGIIKYSFF